MKYDQQDAYSLLLCSKKKEEKEPLEIPGSMIIGGVEILSGSLIWILPFPGAKQVGSVMIADGIRRTFNGVEEKDKLNRSSNPKDNNTTSNKY